MDSYNGCIAPDPREHSVLAHLHPRDICIHVVKHRAFQVGQVVQVPSRLHVLLLLWGACRPFKREPGAMPARMEVRPILHCHLRREKKRKEL